MQVLGLIPARGGSKGVVRKNVRLLAGRPLIAYTIDAAHGSRTLTRYACTTDDVEIARIATSLGCSFIERPNELAQDATPMRLVVEHALATLESREGYRPEVAVILQPTSPLRSSDHIDRAVEMLLAFDADSVVSVTAVPEHYHPDWQLKLGEDQTLSLWNGHHLGEIVTRRQDLSPSFTRNGAVYAFRVDGFLKSGSIYGNRTLGFLMSPEDSINIDADVDFKLAESRITALQKTEARH